MRYIIETAVLHGRILNRTTIIPSYIYARACEFEKYVIFLYWPPHLRLFLAPHALRMPLWLIGETQPAWMNGANYP